MQSADRSWPRGVYEVELSPHGYRAFNIVYSNGDISFHRFPGHRVTASLLRGMLQRLDRDDPLPHLSLVRPAGPSSPPSAPLPSPRPIGRV